MGKKTAGTFVPGDPRCGRPKGSRTRITNSFFAMLEKVWDEPHPVKDGLARLEAAYRIALEEEPGRTLSWTVDRVIPREVKLEPVTSELSDGELDDMILRLREQLAERAPLLIEAKATNGSGPAAPAE